MASLRDIELVAVGDPFDRRTWSGTPKALANAAAEAGLRVSGFSPMPVETTAGKLVGSISAMTRYGPAAGRLRHHVDPIRRCARSAMREHVAQCPDLTRLHTDTLWLGDALSGRHFLYRDTSPLDLLTAFRAPRRLVREALDDTKRLDDSVERLFVTSEWAKANWADVGFPRTRIDVVGSGIGFEPPPVSEQQIRNASSTGRTLVVAKVRFRQKGIDLLLAGFRLARRALPHLTLDVVAPRGAIDEEPGVTVHSGLSLDELLQVYGQSALYAMPARYEPWGLVYLEAMACGTPILGSGNGAFPELCDGGRNGYVVNDLTPQGVADVLVEAHSQPEDLYQKGVSAAAAAARYSWPRTVSLITERIQS